MQKQLYLTSYINVSEAEGKSSAFSFVSFGMLERFTSNIYCAKRVIQHYHNRRV